MDAVIRVSGLAKRFGELEVLRGIDCAIAASEVVCVIGPSGSGKSTLLRCLNGLEEASAGEVVVHGIRVNDPATDLDALRAEIGMVFQRFNLFPHKTAIQNITEAPIRVRKTPEAEAVEMARALLARVGLSAKENAYPAQLSGGQQQRVAIARAIVADPTFLLCDEPTGDLDRRTASEILDLMDMLVRDHKKTILMVTHDPKAAERAHQTLHLDKGVLVEAAGAPL